MCKYFSRILYAGCAHTVDNLTLPPSECVLFAPCKRQSDAIQAAAARAGGPVPLANFSHWHNRLIRHSLANRLAVPQCRIRQVVNETAAAPVEDASRAGGWFPVCPDCKEAQKALDEEWDTMLKQLLKVSGKARDGVYANDPGAPGYMKELRTDAAQHVTALTARRNMAFADKPVALNVFRSRRWGGMRAFQRMVVHCFLAVEELPTWEDYGVGVVLDIQRQHPDRRRLDAILADGRPFQEKEEEDEGRLFVLEMSDSD